VQWTAHKKVGAETIPVTVTRTESDAQFLELAIERNAKHGLQLSLDDKESVAIKIWLETPRSERETKEAHLCKILSVGSRQLARFLSRAKKETKERAQKTAFDLWSACYTQEEIAERLEIERRTVADWLANFGEFGHMSESAKAAANHAIDFERPIYNVWKTQEKTPGSGHFGNSEPRWLDNLL
jgi:ParB-like chromosome segregation protein Spo0J